MDFGLQPTWTDSEAQAVLRVFDAVSRHRDREQLFLAITDVLRSVLTFDGLVIVLDGPGDEVTPYFIHPRIRSPR